MDKIKIRYVKNIRYIVKFIIALINIFLKHLKSNNYLRYLFNIKKTSLYNNFQFIL